MMVARRMRLDSVSTGLPAVLWAVILIGALINMTRVPLFKVEDTRLHLVMVTLLAMFIGLVIFMILALDRPFRGNPGLGRNPISSFTTI